MTREKKELPRVNIEDTAYGDIRFAKLGRATGQTRFDCLGRMAHVWRHCTSAQTYEITREDFELLYEIEGSFDLAVAAGMLEKVGDGVAYVRGTKGRIEWLSAQRENAAKGGRANAARYKESPTESPNGAQRLSQMEPEPQPEGSPPTPALSPALTPTKEESLASYFVESIRTHHPAYKASESQLRGWADEIDKAIRLDGRTENQLRAVIDYCHRDPAGSFWRANLLSGAKLREKFDQISIQMGARYTASKQSQPVPFPGSYNPNAQGSVPRTDKPFTASAATDKRDPAEASVVAELARALVEKSKFLKGDA